MSATPGPWFWNEERWLVETLDGDRVFKAFDPYDDVDREPIAKDMRLAAAAPELLKALVALLRESDGVDCRIGDRSGKAVRRAHAAIKKAKGIK